LLLYLEDQAKQLYCFN